MNWALLQNTLLVAAAAAALAGLAGTTAAVGTISLPRAAQKGVVLLAIVALALPPFVVVNCWLDLLGAAGWLRPWIPFSIFSREGAILVLALLYWPIPFLLAWSAWRKIEAAQLEADPALRGWALFRWLLWPAARSASLGGAVIGFVLALNNFAVPTILQVKVLPAEVWLAFNTRLDSPAALQASWPMIVAPMIVLLVAARTISVQWPHQAEPAAPRALRRQLGPALVAIALGATCLTLLLSLAMPVVQLAGTERTWTEFVPAIEAGTVAIAHSLLHAAVSAVLAMAVGAALWRFRAAAALWLLFLVPGVLVGIGLAAGMNQPTLSWFYHSATVVIVALVLRYAALAWAGTRAAMREIDPAVDEVVRMETASRAQRYRHAAWPQIAAPVAATAYLIYLLALWDVESLIVVVPPGGETLALRIFNLLHYGHNAHVNALCVALLLLGVAPLLLWTAWRQLRKWPRKRANAGLSLLAAAALAGCSESPGFRLDSKIFDHVEIIGGRGTAPGQFNKPRSVALDRNDNLFVVDMTGRVQKFSPEGKYLLSWQMPETDLGKPKGMDRDRDGNIIVLEPHYQRVNHFTPEGRLVAQWGQKGTNAGQLTLPRAIAVDSKGNVIVSEYTLVDRVQKFSPRGASLLATWGQGGLANGQFNRAEGVAVDSADHIYVADSCNHRIQVFSPDGKFLRAYGKPGRGASQLDYPYDIRIDAEGRQYVCEFGNSRIQVFDAADGPIEIIGRAGPNPGEFANPWSIAFDSKGNLYVADSQNHRVQKLVRRK